MSPEAGPMSSPDIDDRSQPGGMKETPAWSVHLPTGMDPETVDLLAQGTLPKAWQQRWSAHPDAPVIIPPSGPTMDAQTLEQRSANTAASFARAGLRPGDRMLLSAQASPELIISYVAALRLGLVVVPLNPAYTQREVQNVVRDCTPRAAFVDDTDRAAWIGVENRDVLVIAPDGSVSVGSHPALDVAVASDPALICYTSGTTGSPKGAVLTHGNLLSGAEAVKLAWRWHSSDRLVLALPLFHAHGLCIGLNGTLLSGASAVLLPRFTVDGVMDSVSRRDATMFFGVPTMYNRLAQSPQLGELARLRLCVSGSAPLPTRLHARILQATGQHVLERYGMTETLLNVSNPYDGERRPGTVGFPLPGVDVRLHGGREGEILVRGSNVFPGYWSNRAATSEAMRDGWFHSGDIGQLDADGYLSIVGRTKELIITGGFNVHPREVEEILLEHPDVAEVAVIGAPSEEWGEVVTAFVVLTSSSESLNADHLREFAAERLAAFKTPRVIHFVAALPRNPLGKVLKSELLTWA